MGKSRQRLGRDHAPTHEEISAFADRLARRIGYLRLDESPESKVVLLGRSAESRFLPGRTGPTSLPVLATA
jgi:wyosine [tRNA(Phe)-imidazoG37] synthetase (radical SAM superfamily)